MSDDVKVKFGGDFTDVPKGADSAGKIAGTAIAASFKEYTKSLTSSLASFFSVSNLVNTFANNFSAALDKFREIDQLSRQLGVSRVELQKFSKLGAEVGISMETMARSIGFANKTIGAAQMHNGAQRQSLLDLGFTIEQITAGHIKATDVMFKLAEAYDKNKNSNNLAKQTTEVFGRAGQELTRILKDGNVQLQERIRLMKVYSEEAVRGGAVASRYVEIFQKKAAKLFGGKQAELAGYTIAASELSEARDETRKKLGIKDDTSISQLRESGKFPEYYSTLLKNAAKRGLSAADVLSITQTGSEQGTFFQSQTTKDDYAQLLGFLRNTVQEEETAQNKRNLSDTGDLVDAGSGGPVALLASSLQQIGGGDIASVMSGFGANEVADNTKRTADGVQKLVEKNVDQTPVSDVAK
jgi:hypothetical protein